MRLMVVEDNDALRGIIVKRLKAEGYAVDECGDGVAAFENIQDTQYDALILDIMLPGMDGLELLKRIRGASYTCGVLLLTARDSIDDRVRGLDMGADDYLVKPFAFEELLARVRALLRKHTADQSPVLTLDDLQMNTSAHTVQRGGTAVALTAKEYAMLEYFMHHIGQVLTRDQIADHVWNYEYSFESNLVDVYVRYLREKIDKAAAVKLLHTVRGVGYVLRVEA